MAYNVVLRRNGAKVGHFGPFSTKKQAIAQGQVLADDSARDVVVSVEPQRKKATTKRKKRTNTRRKNPVGPGQKFVIIDTSVPGGKWVDGVIYDGTAKADRKAKKLWQSGRKVQVIDAVWFEPSAERLRVTGMRGNTRRKNPARTRSNPASKSILKRIDLANKWIAFAQKHDIWGIDPYMNTSSNGVIIYTHKITVSAQKNRATFKYTDGYPKLGKKESETYNLNDTDTYSYMGVSSLRYAINSLIIKPIKRGAKDEGKTIPASLR